MRYHTALKVLGVLQTLLLAAFAIVSMRTKAAPQLEQADAAPPALAGTAPPAPAVRALTDETLPAFVDGLPAGVLLNFHMTSCSHCKALAPEFEAAARELEAQGGAPLASVNVAAAPRAVQRYGVRRFPTMLWFRMGEPVLELPPTARQAAKIVEYVTWASQPAVIAFDSRAELEEALPQLRAVLTERSPPLICGFGVSGRVYDTLEAVAEKLRGKTMFLFTEEAQAGDAPLRAYFQNEKLDQDFMGRVDQQAVHTWVDRLLRKAKKEAKPSS